MNVRNLFFLIAFIFASSAAQAETETFALTHVTIIDVDSDSRRIDQTIIVRNGVISKTGDARDAKIPANAEIIDGSGKFLIPGLWDMHVHSHREDRWKYHYPLFLAHGVTGVRDAGSHLGSALAARERTKDDPLAPHVIWGSPIIDGAPQVNSFGLSAEDDASARALVREMRALGFDFIKTYDRLSAAAYHALADEAQKRKIPIEGHVPLSLSPDETTKAGQTVIDHLTLVLESCTPGALDLAHEEFAKAPSESDSLALMMDDRFADALGDYDAAKCERLFQSFAANGVWQVPTLVEMRGYFHADNPQVTSDPRAYFTTPALLADWRDFGADADPDDLANGKRVFAAQMSMTKQMRDAGVGLLAGTDASSEPWVFAGASLHDELKLFVDAGLTPLESLKTATINPLRYQGRDSGKTIIAKGQPADLVLLNADPTVDISATTNIEGVFKKGAYFDRAALDALIEQGKAEAVSGRL